MEELLYWIQKRLLQREIAAYLKRTDKRDARTPEFLRSACICIETVV